MSRQLRHKDSAITLKVYARWFQTKRVAAVSIDWTRRNHPQPPRNPSEKLLLEKIV